MTSTTVENSVFKGTSDRYDGITVNSVDESCDKDKFTSKLLASLDVWTHHGKRGIWFKVDLQHADWVPILTKNGFKYHHARNDFVMLYKWLPDEPCNIPPFAHTMIGVGAVVVNDKNEVLVVREKYFNKLPFWKLPGGYVEPCEKLETAIIREVKEETNIDTEFDSFLSLRHAQGRSFDCSDMYIVMSLKPLSSNIIKCNQEIAKCEWMPIEQYLNHPDIHELNKHFVEKYVEYKEKHIKIELKEGVHQLLKIPYTVFSATIKKP